MKKNRALLLLLALILAGCKDFSFYGVLGDRIDDTPLQIAPAAASVAVGATLDFTAAGGKPPYIFLVAGGPGSFSDADTFLASAAGTVQVQVTDSKGRTSIATVSVTSTGSPLAISPTDVSMGPGGQVQFVASGGTGSPPSYFFTLAASSESGATLSAAGDYQAGPNLGQDTIELTDGVDMVTAQVDVTAAVTNVEYVLSASIIPAAGTGGDDFTYSFTIQNTGSGNGTQPVSWWLYISDDGSLGSGDTLLGSGNAGYLASLDSAPITTQSGTWPRSSGSKTLFVMIAAEDDLTVYTSGGIPVLLSPPDIDYKLSGLAPGSGTTTGGALSGTFDLINSGSSDGKQPVSWTVYVSTDDTWQASDPVVDAGSVAALDNGLGHSGIAFDGTWPPAADDYYLIVRVFASDEPSPADAADNELISPSPGVTVTEAPIDYAAISITSSGSTAGGPVSGTFTLQNHGTANGTEDVFWTAYASAGNDTLELGTDVVIDAGVVSPPPTISLPRIVSYSGLWPDTPGNNYHLLMRISASDEPAANTVDNLGKLGPLTTDVPNYTVSVVTHLSGTTAGAPFSGRFTLQNLGTVAGGEDVAWVVYASTDSNLEIGTDAVVDVGAYSLPRLGPSPAQTDIDIHGSWPPDVEDNYFLIVTVAASDEIDLSNNVKETIAAVPVNRPAVNYAVSNFSYSGTAPFAPATPVAGSFRYGNASSMDDGTQWVNWTVYASLDGTIDASDNVVVSGSLPPLASGQTSGLIPFNGLWPLVYGNYSLILQAGSAWELETDTADNRAISAAVSVGIYNAIVQNGDCVNLTNYTDLVGVVLKPGMSLKVISGGYPPAHLDHLFRLNTGTANTVTASWVLDNTTATEDIGIFFYRGPPGAYFGGGYWIAGRASITLTFAVDAPSVMRWIDLYSDKNKNLGSYVLYITAN